MLIASSLFRKSTFGKYTVGWCFIASRPQSGAASVSKVRFNGFSLRRLPKVFDCATRNTFWGRRVRGEYTTGGSSATSARVYYNGGRQT